MSKVAAAVGNAKSTVAADLDVAGEIIGVPILLRQGYGGQEAKSQTGERSREQESGKWRR